MDKNYTFAVLVDGENARPNDLPGALREVEKKGDVALTRVYADWTLPPRSSWKPVLHECGARPVQQFNYGKDAADHALIMDAVELTLNTPRLDAICIVSSDGGYHTLAQRIREKGLYVMGIGRRNTPERLRRACHHFVYTDLLEADAEEVLETSLSLDELLIKAYKSAAVEDEAVYLGILGGHLKRLDPAFDPRSFSFDNLKALIKAQDHLFQVDSETQDRCFVSLNPSARYEAPLEIREGYVKRWCGLYGFIESEHQNYYFHRVNVRSDQRPHRFQAGDAVLFSVVKQPDPHAEHSSDRNGKAKNVEVMGALRLLDPDATIERSSP